MSFTWQASVVYVGMVLAIVVAVVVSGSYVGLLALFLVAITYVELSSRSVGIQWPETIVCLCIAIAIIAMVFKGGDSNGLFLMILIPAFKLAASYFD
jgi:hypothetical protein